MFSRSSSFMSISVDFSNHPAFLRKDVEIYPLKRDTNEWTRFFGVYPMFCASITNEDEIANRIANGERHVVGLKIDQPENLMRRDVMRKIGELLWQLSSFEPQGIFWEDALHWSKSAGSIIIQFDGNDVVFRLFVCDDSGMFHILADEISLESTEKFNKLIYSVRVLFQNNDPFTSFESIELTPEKWEATYDVTIDHSCPFV